jgi:hypothetical protein
MSVGASFGRFVGKGQVIRKDGTVEPFTIDTGATREQRDLIQKANLQNEKSNSQEQTKGESNT